MDKDAEMNDGLRLEIAELKEENERFEILLKGAKNRIVYLEGAENEKLKADNKILAECLQEHHDKLNIDPHEYGDLEFWVVVDGYAESDLCDKTIEALKQIDHSDLAGLSDEDAPQYPIINQDASSE